MNCQFSAFVGYLVQFRQLIALLKASIAFSKLLGKSYIGFTVLF